MLWCGALWCDGVMCGGGGGGGGAVWAGNSLLAPCLNLTFVAAGITALMQLAFWSQDRAELQRTCPGITAVAFFLVIHVCP